MKRAPLILLLAFAGGVALFAASYLLAQRVCTRHAAEAGDELVWLEQEFHLNADEMKRVRALHEGYLPQCAEFCARIAVKKRELDAALAGATNLTEVAEQKLVELGTLRAQCQAQMLRHFMEVSRAMPPEEGQRYLAEMQYLTLGYHERFEQSMSSPPADHEHGHH